jgi:hypothetical protein
MKAPAVLAALFAILLTAAYAGATPAVTVRESRLTFNQALAACPGALGTVTFTLGHTRIASQPGVQDETDTTSPGLDEVTFLRDSDKKSARILTNGHDRTVNAKHVTLASNDRVACVAPDY